MLEGIDGVFAIIDDILIAGKEVEHHDQILRKVVERATAANLKLKGYNQTRAKFKLLWTCLSLKTKKV